MNLFELQRYFASAATSGAGPVAGLDEVFASSPQSSARDRLSIYNRAYFYRLLDALGAVFAQTLRILGPLEFERVGLAYLTQHPSEHPAIERVGRHFASYLQRLPVAPPEPAIDVARLEWARLCALVAPNPAALAQPNALEPSAFPDCRVLFVPGLSWLELDSRALSAFAGAPSNAPRSSKAVAVWRAGQLVQHQLLEIAEFKALGVAHSGAPMREVCAVFDTGDEAADIQRAFGVVAAWYARSWLESVEIVGA